MLIEDIVGKFQNWKSKRTELPIPPRSMLYHASPAMNHESIMQQGILNNGVCKLYKGCTEGVVFLADNPRTAVEMVGDDNPGIDHDMLDKSEGRGVLYEINPRAIDPRQLRQDPALPPQWLNPKFTYMYAGSVPANAIVGSKEFTIQGSYYLGKSFTSTAIPYSQ
jgi:hypothetical protein